MKYGKVLSGGGTGRIAMASGTAYNMINSYAISSKIASGYGGSGPTKLTTTTTTTTTTTSSGSSSSSDTTADEFEETIDWIEIAIDRLERAISSLDLKASSVYNNWGKRNEALADQINEVGNEIELQQKAYDRYMQEAESVGLSEKYAKQVREGTIDITTITDEDLYNQIDLYRQW